MPTLARFAKCRITMYALDHNPPHFHVVATGFEILVEIGTWRRIGGYGRPREIDEALQWARA